MRRIKVFGNRLVYAVMLCVMVLSMSCYADASENPQGEFDVQMAVLERFLNYVKHDTESDPDSDTAPSTGKQMPFAKLLYEECKTIGLFEVELSEYGIVTATLPGNIEADVPVLGFIAHIDTSPEFSGLNVVPRIFYDYDGKDIVLNAQTIISPEEFPALHDYIGQTIITASGNTLLGADDKAGIAEILTAMEYLIRHPEIPHGKIRVAFTPDEEIGRGTDNFDVGAFGAAFAFTVDGGRLGELEFENFNAAGASFEIKRGNTVNSLFIALEIASAFPPDETPAKTEGYEGFFHLTGIKGDGEETKMDMIIRDFDKENFEARKKFVADLADSFNTKYGKNTVTLNLRDQYYNMKEKIAPDIIEYATSAFSAAGVEPIIVPVRGGTDGAMLSYKGLPCPNIFAGGHNWHGPYEFVPLESMEKAVHVIVSLATAADTNRSRGYAADGGQFTASFEIMGRSIHPGAAKGIMKNASLIALEIASAFPAAVGKRFFDMEKFDGGVAKTVMDISIRYSSQEEFDARKKFVSDLADSINKKYGGNTVKLELLAKL